MCKLFGRPFYSSPNFHSFYDDKGSCCYFIVLAQKYRKILVLGLKFDNNIYMNLICFDTIETALAIDNYNHNIIMLPIKLSL